MITLHTCGSLGDILPQPRQPAPWAAGRPFGGQAFPQQGRPPRSLDTHLCRASTIDSNLMVLETIRYILEFYQICGLVSIYLAIYFPHSGPFCTLRRNLHSGAAHGRIKFPVYYGRKERCAMDSEQRKKRAVAVGPAGERRDETAI